MAQFMIEYRHKRTGKERSKGVVAVDEADARRHAADRCPEHFAVTAVTPVRAGTPAPVRTPEHGDG